MLRALGATVRMVDRPDPETGDLLVARRKLVAQLVSEIPDSFSTDQYANGANPAAHAAGTMREIDEALVGDIDHLFVATSTAGTLLGCCEYLSAHDRHTRVVAVDAVGSVLFGGTSGNRHLPGFGAGLESDLAKRVRFDELVRVSDVECVIGCRRLAEREAILAGASSGAVVMAFEKTAAEMAPGDRCAMIFPDGGAGYLTTVYDDAWVEAELGCTPHDLAALV
jgi:cysteine synthase A